jgi:hypothetical protein
MIIRPAPLSIFAVQPVDPCVTSTAHHLEDISTMPVQPPGDGCDSDRPASEDIACLASRDRPDEAPGGEKDGLQRAYRAKVHVQNKMGHHYRCSADIRYILSYYSMP